MKDMFAQGGSGSVGIKTNKQAIARHFGVKQSEVIYCEVGKDIAGYKVIYDKVSQRSYSLPTTLPAGTVIVSFVDGVLTLTGGAVDLGALAVTREEYVTLPGSFTSGATLTVKNELLVYLDSKYRWGGALPKTVPAGETPASTGGEGNSAWVPVGDITLRTDLANNTDVGKGDNLVGVKQPFAGSKATTVHQKMREIVAINDGAASGAEPDGVTDCSGALLGLVATVNPVVRLPFIPGTANVYYFSAFDPDALQGVTFDVDSGVKLSVPYDWLVSKASAQNLKFTRATRFMFRNLNTEYTVMPGSNEVYAAKDTFLESYAYDRSEAQFINAGGALLPVKIPFPGSDTWTSDTYMFSDTTQAAVGVVSGDNSFHIGVMDVVPGDELNACLLVNGTPQICAIVRSTNGYSGVYASAGTSGISVQQFSKTIGSAPVQSTVEIPMLADHASYLPINSEWKIRINSFSNYDVLFNGYVVTTIYTPGFITDAGFGGYFFSGTSNPLVNIYNPSKIVNSNYTRNTFLSVKVFGDSVSAPRADCWPIYLKKELEFSEGLRAWNIINKAVPGHTSADQLAIMQAEGVDDANVVVIAVGTNDAQAQIALDTYKANLLAMINICVAAGRPVILCKFGLWYTQAQAGAATGQASANYDKGAVYRNMVSRVASETGVKLLDLTSIEGPLTAYYINPALAVNLVGRGDSVVHDNIHPTTMATKTIARAVARSVMGLLSSARKRKISGMQAVTATNSWVINTNDRPVRIDVSEDGIVTLSGIVFKSSGSVAAGTQIAQIPKNMAPPYDVQFSVYADTAGVSLQVLPSGAVKVYGATGSTTLVGVSGLTWALKS
jgi:lysophospholipase L1-like esterase